MNINTSNFNKNHINIYNKVSFNRVSFHAVYRLLPDGSLEFSDESDESLVLLNGYTLKEIMFLTVSELLVEIKRLAYWGLFLESKDELLLAYVALKGNSNNAVVFNTHDEPLWEMH